MQTSRELALSIIHATGGDPKRVDEAAAVIDGFRANESKSGECKHSGYSFEKHGRCCPHCGTFLVDWGD